MKDAAMTTRARPIIMQAESVAGILAGTKTQTRRLVAFGNSTVDGYKSRDLWNALDFSSECRVDGLATGSTAFGTGEYLHVPKPGDGTTHRVRCDYGPGDVLWVRETWAWSGDKAVPESERVLHGECWYRADEVHINPNIRWRSPIHMPRWAARIWLEITAVRVERLQEISEEDAIAEGMTKRGLWWDAGPTWEGDGAGETAREAFAIGWDDINRKRAPWESNPWVWVLTYRRVEQGE